jgi:hypothetical protein
MKTAFEVYKLYITLKAHFNGQYDYFKYGGKTRSVSRKTFDARIDQSFFHILAKHPHPGEFLLANLVDGNLLWIGELVMSDEPKTIFNNWAKRRESLSYVFEQDLERIEDPYFKKTVDSGYPLLLQAFMRRDICIETLTIINDLTDCFESWDKMIDDPVYWPSVHRKCLKYRPFLEYDAKRMQSIFTKRLDVWMNQPQELK